MAKIISQITFADYGCIEILGDLERFLLALLGMDDEALMRKLEARRGNGRNDYPIRVIRFAPELSTYCLIKAMILRR